MRPPVGFLVSLREGKVYVLLGSWGSGVLVEDAHLGGVFRGEIADGDNLDIIPGLQYCCDPS